MFDSVEVPSPRSIWQVAKDHGWHTSEPNPIKELLLIHSEVSEACEALRKGDMDNFAEELADIVIRAFDTAEDNGIDIVKAIWDKCRKNIDRPYRHGGKKF